MIRKYNLAIGEPIVIAVPYHLVFANYWYSYVVLPHAKNKS